MVKGLSGFFSIFKVNNPDIFTPSMMTSVFSPVSRITTSFNSHSSLRFRFLLLLPRSPPRGIIMVGIGVLIGAYLARSSSEKQLRMQLLAGFYSDVFKAYTEYVNSRGLESYLSFVAAAEKTMLLCSPESERISNALKIEMAESHSDGHKCAALLEKLRKEAQREMGRDRKAQRSRKHNQN